MWRLNRVGARGGHQSFQVNWGKRKYIQCNLAIIAHYTNSHIFDIHCLNSLLKSRRTIKFNICHRKISQELL